MKKILSLLLALIMVAALIPMSVFPASASAWDSAGYDCVAYAKARFAEIWGFQLHATGQYNGAYGAHGYYYNAANFGDIVSSVPKVGALAVWTSTANVWGHVAIVEEVNGNNVVYTEGGYLENGVKRANRDIRSVNGMSKSTQPFLGYVYVKGTSIANPNPGKSTFSAAKTSVAPGEALKVSWTASSNTSHYNLKYYYNGAYYSVANSLTATSYTITFSKEGVYDVYVDSCNSNGYTQSTVVRITVTRQPSKPVLTVKRGTSAVNTVFSWAKTTDTSYYVLKVYNSAGSAVVNNNVTGTSYSVKLSAGTYSATVTSVCSNGKTAVSDKKSLTISKAPSKSSDGWYYLSYVPSNVTTSNYTIQYRNTTTKVAPTSPGSEYTNKGYNKTVYTNSGNAYESLTPLATSDTRVLVSTSYFHYCGNSVGNNANYFADSKYNHYDGLSSSGVYEASCQNDYDNPSIKYYTLKNSSGSLIYCSSGYTCDGSWGSHGARCPYWYKLYKYQDKKAVKYYTFTKTSGWTTTKDSSATSVEVRYKPKTQTPAAVGGIKVVNANGGVKISWNKANLAKSYRVYRSVYSNGKWSDYKRCADVSSLSYLDKSVKSGAVVKYTVRGINGSNLSKAVTGVATRYLATVTGIKVTNAARGVQVSWSKVSNAKQYRVYRSVYSNGKWSSYSRCTSTTALTFLDKNVKSGARVKYTVRAVNGNYLSYTATGKATLFLAQISPKVAAVSNGVKISWSKTGGATGYIVCRRAMVNGKWQAFQSLSTTKSLSFVDKTAKKGVYYQYVIKAYNGSFRSASKTSLSVRRW